MIEHLKDQLLKLDKSNVDLIEDFLNLWSTFESKKGDLVSYVDKTDQYLYFIVKGYQKAYYFSDGMQHIIAFSYPYSYTCVPESFLVQTPSKYNLECVTDSSFLRIPNTSFTSFMRQNPEFNVLIIKQLITTINGLVNKYHRLIAFSIEERFQDLMNNSPNLINNISQKDLANYLKMDPTNFSKLINSVKI